MDDKDHDQPTDRESCRLLVIDDQVSVLETIKHQLRLRLPSWTIEAVHDPGTAIERIIWGDYDVILSDIRMPHLDGVSLMRQVHSLLPYTPVVFMTGFADELIQDPLGLGAFAVLEKPLNVDRLITTLQEARQVGACYRACWGKGSASSSDSHIAPQDNQRSDPDAHSA